MSDTPPTPLVPTENVVSLSRFRARHAQDIRQKGLDALLDANNPALAIQSLPGQALYEILRGGDPREHLDVLVHARAEQMQIVFDLALWSNDRLSPGRVEPWIGALAAVPYDVSARWLKGLDVELVALLIRKGARIYDLEIEDPPDEPQGAFYPTPDGFFVLDAVGYRAETEASPNAGTRPAGAEAAAAATEETPEGGADEASADALIHIVDNLYRSDLNFARRILVGAKAELDSELEETAYRWRKGRLADLGFEDPASAREIYRPLDPATVRIGELRPGTRVRPLDADHVPGGGVRAPAALAVELEGGSLFARARARVTDVAEIGELDAALFALTNRLLAADSVDPGNDAAVAAHLARMRGTLDLALDYLARRPGAFDEDRAVDAVRTVAIGRLFRVGVSLTAKVRMLAAALRRGAPFAGTDTAAELDLVEAPESEVLDAALRAHPAFPCVLDDPPRSGERPIASLLDLARITAAIERAAAAQMMLLGLGFTTEVLNEAALVGTEPADRAALDTAVLARTAIVLALLRSTARAAVSPEREPPRPLTPLEVGRFKKQLAVSPALRDRARALLAPLAPASMSHAAREMSERWIASLDPLEPVLVRPTRRPPRHRGAD
jgi:hypothetical protein